MYIINPIAIVIIIILSLSSCTRGGYSQAQFPTASFFSGPGIAHKFFWHQDDIFLFSYLAAAHKVVHFHLKAAKTTEASWLPYILSRPFVLRRLPSGEVFRRVGNREARFHSPSASTVTCGEVTLHTQSRGLCSLPVPSVPLQPCCEMPL